MNFLNYDLKINFEQIENRLTLVHNQIFISKIKKYMMKYYILG